VSLKSNGAIVVTKTQVWIGTSWKMNKVLSEALAFAEAIGAADEQRDQRIQRFVIPSHTNVREVKKALSQSSVKVGVQNMHWADDGAWTGEISPLMVKDCGAEIVELGHSERREHFNETDSTVGLKVAAAVHHGLVPLICIGETLQQREAGKATEVLKSQVEGALDRLSGVQKDALILLAYEPVWAIGVNGIPATAEYAEERHAEIVATSALVLGRRLPCLYGGSVNVDNCAELIQRPNIDGLFIGRSAWDANGYLEILNRCSAVL
jgi:L-erythrulose 1-phosphate isomerase